MNVPKALIIWVIILSILYSTLSVVRHNHFQSGGFDLGLYDQAVWQYSKFIWPYNTIKDRFILGDHLTLTLPIMAPLFWVWNDVRMLLIFQAVFISLSVVAVYKLVRLRKFSPFAALGISFVYSLFYGIQYGIFFDFHPVLLATGLIPWMLYFLESKRTKLFIGTLVLLVLTQENMGLALASLGFIYIFQKNYRKKAFMFIIGGVIVSFMSVKVINLFFPFQYVPQITLNPWQLFNAPEKRQVWLYTLSSFSFLPLLSPGALLAVAFDLAQYFMSGPTFERMWSPFMHHRAILAPYVFLGTLDALAWLKSKKINIKLVVVFLVLSALVQQFIFHWPLNKLSKSEFWNIDSWVVDNEKMIATILPDMKLATQQSLVPHLSHRNIIYIAWPRVHDFTEKPCGQISCWWLDTDSHAQYLLIDSHPNEWLTMLLETPEHVNEAISNMEKLKKIILIRQIHDVRLYKINN
jgi:uncharacterized membrane protein